MYIGDEGGYYHPRCYHLAHPFIPVGTVDAIVYNSADCVLARQLCVRYIDPVRADAMIEEFNRIMQARWLLRISE